jgi:hypothetical protein
MAAMALVAMPFYAMSVAQAAALMSHKQFHLQI